MAVRKNAVARLQKSYQEAPGQCTASNPHTASIAQRRARPRFSEDLTQVPCLPPHPRRFNAAVGFTGKKALAFKLAYIDAFNSMEAELQNQPAQGAQRLQLAQTLARQAGAQVMQTVFA